MPDLSPAQERVAALVAAGHQNKAIAHQLGIAEATVGVHIFQTNKRLGVQNRVQLAMWHLRETANRKRRMKLKTARPS